MSWEENAVKNGNRFAKKAVKLTDEWSYLHSIVNKIGGIIEKTNENFKKAGLQPQKETHRYSYSYRGPGISGLISITVSDTLNIYKKLKHPEIQVHLCAHSVRKSYRYGGDINEQEVISWIKFVTRQPTIIDKIKKITGAYYGEV